VTVRSRAIIAGLLILVGLVWIGQGTDVIPGSGFMNGDIRWSMIGLVVLVVGIVLAVTVLNARRRT
jgi:heme/copper-type cytochrome/quinol oxidase subunit 2